jgi:hypothetical protein
MSYEAASAAASPRNADDDCLEAMHWWHTKALPCTNFQQAEQLVLQSSFPEPAADAGGCPQSGMRQRSFGPRPKMLVSHPAGNGEGNSYSYSFYASRNILLVHKLKERKNR